MKNLFSYHCNNNRTFLLMTKSSTSLLYDIHLRRIDEVESLLAIKYVSIKIYDDIVSNMLNIRVCYIELCNADNDDAYQSFLAVKRIV